MTATLNYYTDPVFLKYVSNSQLGDFKKALYLIPERSLNLQDIFDFGNLVDAKVSEEHKLDFPNRILAEESSNRLIQFSQQDWDRGMAMGDAVNGNSIIKLLKPTSIPQYIIMRRKHEYNYQGDTVHMPTRCKFDFLNKVFKVAIDIKTTSCTTQESFVKSMKTFSYFRQGAMYMDLARIDKMWYIAVSKTKDRFGKYPVFQFAIKRGDENYNWGKAEYSKLGYLYYHMIYNFQLPNLIHI